MAQVAPEQQVMVGGGQLRPQPSLPGNGCCCVCCGKAPEPVDPAKIIADGGRYIQAADGRIVEYFVIGSNADEARVLLIVNGSMGTGWMWGQLPELVQQLEVHNLKAICITVPGFGYSTAQANRKIGDWPKDDVEPVLAAEGVTGQFMVEGSSFGTAHAQAVAHYFGERVRAMHLIVPYIPIPLREELGFKKYIGDDAMKCDPSYANNCRSCCLFCCCSCQYSILTCCPCCCDDKSLDKAAPGSARTVTRDVIRSGAHAIHGWLLNGFVPTVSDNWGFDPREIKTQKVIISYAEKDEQCDAAHGRFLGEHFGKQAASCRVNVNPGGHSGFSAEMVRGELVTAIAQM